MIRLTTTLSGIAESTLTIDCDDVVRNFTNLELNSSRGNRPIQCLITVEGNAIRFGIGSNPTQGADGSGAAGHVLYAGQSILLDNSVSISNFRFLNHTNLQNAFIQVTMFYAPGQ